MIFMTRDEIRKYDEIALLEYGVEGVVLMENAGGGAARVILESLLGTTGSVAVVAGQGNNGGDGFVVARHLVNAGRMARVFFLGRRDALEGDARKNFEILLKMDIGVTDMPREGDVEDLAAGLRGSAAVVDAVFGTGLDKEVKGRLRRAIEIVNESGLPVFSLDLPSGLDADTGLPLGACVKATKTIAFAFLKRGLVVHPGCEYAGEVRVVDIGAPGSIVEKTGYDGEVIEDNVLRRWMRPRRPDSHKGSYGHVLVIAGSRGKTGAAIMASLGALRSGSGLVTIAAREGIASTIDAAKPVEAMMEAFDPASPDTVNSLLDGKDAVAFGPGCGLGNEMSAVLEALLERCRVPLVVDADGLTLLAREAGLIQKACCPVILTPHPGEMARLAGVTKEEVQAFRIPVSREFAGRTRTHLILKGARTVIADPGGRAFVNTTGNPGMASGGMGDVLTGMVTSFCGQGYSPLEASCLAVFIHGRAGDRARETSGEGGLIASDLIDRIPAVLKDIEDRAR